MISHKQLSLADIFIDCQNKFENDKYQFFQLLDNTLDLDEIVPVSFILHFNALTGRPRRHLLYPMLKALLLKHIFSIPTVTRLIIYRLSESSSLISLGFQAPSLAKTWQLKPENPFYLVFKLYNQQFLVKSIERGLIDPTHLSLAGDGTHVRTAAKQRKKGLCKCREDGSP